MKKRVNYLIALIAGIFIITSCDKYPVYFEDKCDFKVNNKSHVLKTRLEGKGTQLGGFSINDVYTPLPQIAVNNKDTVIIGTNYTAHFVKSKCVRINHEWFSANYENDKDITINLLANNTGADRLLKIEIAWLVTPGFITILQKK